ncbi:MAG TPA: hypothetical protein VM537_30815, partial [Anaerolineae bacterium]|nr:hypothetical protein [Anaerolineae bacterium]
HAALWNGHHLTLAPAYDIDPCRTPGWDANQAMAYGRDGERSSSLASLINVSATYDLDRPGAADIVDRVITSIHDNWDQAVDHAGLTQRQAESLYGSRILNESTTHGLRSVTPSGWDASVVVNTDPSLPTGPVRVQPHQRNGRPVQGH